MHAIGFRAFDGTEYSDVLIWQVKVENNEEDGKSEESSIPMIAFGLLRLGLIESRGWLIAISGLLLAAGIYLSSIIFDLLGRRGMVFGKFLILGPLVGGLYLALTPMTEFGALTRNGVMYVLMEHVLLGVVIGDGVGLGVEVAELLGMAQRKSRRS